MSLKEILQKKKDPIGYIESKFDLLKEFVLTRLGEFEARLNAYQPIHGDDGEPGAPGKDGENYVLTEEDKREIAGMITVPVVEKVIERTETIVKETPAEIVREIVHETPIITEIVKEKAVADTATAIADKLNTTEESLTMAVIKGLSQELNDLRRSIREMSRVKGGGGGMGNPQHESTAVSAVTTTITTTFPIAANGYALWAYYQGQFIVRGTHYTVGADRKTLTLLFTPEDGTNIDIIYVR